MRDFAQCAERMRAEGLSNRAIKSFEYYFRKLESGESGLVPEESITPVISLPDAQFFPDVHAENGKRSLSKTVLIKLNGGLGTSMGLDKAKSLLLVKSSLSFLDIAAQHALKNGVRLVLMNSFMTHDDSMAAIGKYPGLFSEIPLAFQQHKVPKITKAELSPVSWPPDPRLEWCPPGHGDIYTALITSGTLDRLLESGYEYAFVSNVDNLGAVLDPSILGYFVRNHLSFMMEAADRTQADKKGGHLAFGPNGKLLLRELAQSARSDIDAFQDTMRHKYFNTNNIWLNLKYVKQLMTEIGDVLELPMICNSKTVDPRDRASTEVYQLETAMGAAIGLFENAEAIRVPRSRFAPVKTTSDLLAVRSDLYSLTDDFRIVPNPARKFGQIVMNLDRTHYGMIDSMERLFPYGAPCLLDCERLCIEGKIRFGRNVTLRGSVRLVNKSRHVFEVEDNSIIQGT